MKMEFNYSDEQNSLMIVALLKAHGIKKVVVSPGTTNIYLIVSMMNDKSFEMYSCIDERSAAYMACGIAAESGEPVVIVCTEATASRNYLSGLTEAYHRKLPILAITGMHGYSCIGHLEPQVIDRSISPKDSIRLKVNLPVLNNSDDTWESMIKINQAILELKRHGGGPVHINLPWPGSGREYSVKELPEVRVIKRYCIDDSLPDLPQGKVAVFVGSHTIWSSELVNLVDEFCAAYDSVVFCDYSSKYYGKYGVCANLVAAQIYKWDIFSDIDLVIHLGEEVADRLTMDKMKSAKETWRVSEDGEIRDTFRNLKNVFEMSESSFFTHYINMARKENREARTDYLKRCQECYKNLFSQIPKLPFSNVYIASKIAPHLPEKSIIHFGASNTIRAWSVFELPKNVRADSNMGCRGIDGAVSASVGISLVHPEHICYCVVGDLTFFYDMSILGNRHISNNYRILIINNSGGNIFKQKGALGYRLGDETCDLYISAGGHYGVPASNIIKQYVTALGYEYLTASSCHEFDKVYMRFLSPDITRSMVFEVFVKDEDERMAFDSVYHIIMDQKSKAKNQVKQLIGEKGVTMVKGLLKK